MQKVELHRAWEEIPEGDSRVGKICFDPKVEKLLGSGNYLKRISDILTAGDSPHDVYVLLGKELPKEITYIIRSQYFLEEGTKENPVEYRVEPRITTLNDFSHLVDSIDIVLASDPEKVVVRLAFDKRVIEPKKAYPLGVGRIDVTWDFEASIGSAVLSQILGEITENVVGAYEFVCSDQDAEIDTYVLKSTFFDEVADYSSSYEVDKLPEYTFTVNDRGLVPLYPGSSCKCRQYHVCLYKVVPGDMKAPVYHEFEVYRIEKR